MEKNSLSLATTFALLLQNFCGKFDLVLSDMGSLWVVSSELSILFCLEGVIQDYFNETELSQSADLCLNRDTVFFVDRK